MEDQFSFKEVDKEGEKTLHTISQAKRFNKWMYDTIRPYCYGKILEIGSGTGNISEFFIEEKSDIVLSDVRHQYCVHLIDKFPDQTVLNIDLITDEFDHIYKNQLKQYDTVFALNVVEHIEDDFKALCNAKKLLKEGGQCIILVPAFKFLYNSFDKDLLHFRRYNRKSLSELMNSQLEEVHSRYFNPVGILGWYVNGNILNKKDIPADQMQFFDRFVPAFKFIDFFTSQLFGLSVVAVGRKT